VPEKSIYSADQECLQRLLRNVRQAAGLNQTQLAAQLDRPQSFVSKVESGERRMDVLELREFCRGVGLSLETFVRKLQRALEGTK
jgi:transcriptional regulator with XRE-family HTH domain